MNTVSEKRSVFVCGISGVGKTHLIQQILPQLRQAISWTASEIIGEARQNADPEFLRTLPTEELARSQEFLVHAFRVRWVETAAPLILLDGHSVLDTEAGYFAIDTTVTRRLDPMAFVHIEDHVERILARRTADPRKRRPPRTSAQLREYQDRSKQACEGFSQALHRPMFRIHAGDADGFLAALSALGVIAQRPDGHV